jgi:hypothetical protein
MPKLCASKHMCAARQQQHAFGSWSVAYAQHPICGSWWRRWLQLQTRGRSSFCLFCMLCSPLCTVLGHAQLLAVVLRVCDSC